MCHVGGHTEPFTKAALSLVVRKLTTAFPMRKAAQLAQVHIWLGTCERGSYIPTTLGKILEPESKKKQCKGSKDLEFKASVLRNWKKRGVLEKKKYGWGHRSRTAQS